MLCCYEVARKFGISYPQFKLRSMKKRWASCTKRKMILVNPELVKAPIHCIQYVLMHELCHLKEPHHGPRFYRLLSRCLPDWESRKARLELVFLA